MQFDLRTIEVDGSLRNPVVVAVVLIWTTILSLASARAAHLWSQSRRATQPEARGRGVAAILLALLLYLATPLVQGFIGSVLYMVRPLPAGRPSVISVGFWGGPPVWPAWLAALLTAYLVWRRNHGEQTQRPQNR